MSKKFLIIEDEAELKDFETFESEVTTIDVDDIKTFDDCRRDSKKAWKPNQLFQFHNAEVQKKYETQGISTFAILRKSVDFFTQGRSTEECGVIPLGSIRPPALGQGFLINTRLAQKDGELITVTNLYPGWNEDDGIPRSNAKGEPYEYDGKTYGVEGERVASATGPMHQKAENQQYQHAIKTPQEKFYRPKQIQIAGGVWKGYKRQQIGTIIGHSVSQNFRAIGLNPLFLICNCAHIRLTIRFKRIMPPELLNWHAEGLHTSLPCSPEQKPGIFRGINPTDPKNYEIMGRWSSLHPLELKNMLEQRLLYFSKMSISTDSTPGYYTAGLVVYHSRKQNIELNLNVSDEDVITPLMHCVKKGDYESMMELLEAGANPFFQNKNFETAMSYALKKEEPILTKYRETLEKYEKIQKEKDEHAELVFSLMSSASQNDFSRLMEMKNPPLNEVHPISHLSFMHYAVAHKNFAAVKFLLGKKVSLDRVSIYGSTPLHFAARDSNFPMIKLLIEAGAKTDVRTSEGRLPEDLMDDPQIKSYIQTARSPVVSKLSFISPSTKVQNNKEKEQSNSYEPSF